MKVLQMADAAVLASGTVTLETAILRCPQVVCYRMAGGALFFAIGKFVLNIKWVSLVEYYFATDGSERIIATSLHGCKYSPGGEAHVGR